MESMIFYFSGTGNSLSVVRDIAERLGNTKLIPISNALKKGTFDFANKKVGFVFPSYYACVPSIVRRFIAENDFHNAKYLYGVVTFGGAYGMTLAQLSEGIAKSGGVLNAGFSVRMPGNYIDSYDAWPSALQRFVLGREKKKINKIVSVIKKEGSTRIPKGSFILRSTEKTDLEILSGLGNKAKNYHTNEKCTGCGVCEKVCPVGNIKLTDAHPVWGSSCEHCVACIQWCPQKAIEYADITATRTRYHNPDVMLSDFISNIKKVN